MNGKPKKQKETEDDRFLRTGVASVNLNINIKVTEKDLLKDLVNRTEGENIDIEPTNDN